MPDRNGLLESLVESRRTEGRKTLVPFLTAGYPDPDTFATLMGEVAAAGCPVVEIGIPFSDPVADGPVIQAASQQALAQGVTLQGVLEMAGRAHADHGLQVVLMGYLNPILKFGPGPFAAACAASGVVGLIVPDLPREEAGALSGVLADSGVTLIDLVAPTTDPDRLEVFGRQSRGFLYLVSSTGVTGSRSSGNLEEYIGRVRRVCRQPLFVGFGISSPEDAAEVARHADGVIIGSALLRLIAEAPDSAAAVQRVGQFLREVDRALTRTTEGAGS